MSSVGPIARDQLVFLVLTRLQVNNVGKSHTAPVYFAEAAEKEVEDILRINVNANVRVTKLILPRMIERYFHFSRSAIVIPLVTDSYSLQQPPRPDPEHGFFLRHGHPLAHARDVRGHQGLPLRIHRVPR